MRVFYTLFFLTHVLLSQSQSIITPAYPGLLDMTDELNCLLTNTSCNTKDDQPIKIILSAGTWVINGTVILKHRDHIYLDHGASILRQYDVSRKTESSPIFHLIGDYATIEGSNRNEIRSEQSYIPDGMIKIGHLSSSARGGIDHCKVDNVVICGPEKSKANRSGLVGIYFYNNQAEPSAPSNNHSYFHTVHDVVFQRLGTGIKTYNTNACTFSNLVFNRVGIDGGYAFLLEGSQENKISNVHHHYSLHANSIGFKDSKYAYPAIYNSIVNYVIEFGKAGRGHAIEIAVPVDEFYNNTLSISCNHDKVVAYPLLNRSLDTKQQRTTYFNKRSRNTLLDHSMYVMFKDK